MDHAKNKNNDLKKPLVGIIMGSQSDMKIMSGAAEALEIFKISFEISVVSAHRTPQKMFEYAASARKNGLKIIIAGAGGAAHLPGMVAAITTLPVIGVPIKASNSLDGWDSLLSIVQMPTGIPVATVAVNGAKNAGLLAAQMIGIHDARIADKLVQYRTSLADKSYESNEEIKKKGWKSFALGT